VWGTSSCKLGDDNLVHFSVQHQIDGKGPPTAVLLLASYYVCLGPSMG